MEKVKTHIIQDIPPLKLNSNISDVKLLMEKNNFTHFPVVDQENWLGNIFAEDVYSLNDEDSLGTLRHNLDIFFVKEDSGWFDILEQCSKYESNLIPVINNKNEYLGYYLFMDIIHLFADTPFITERGITLTIKKNKLQYSFSEISQIVESNNSNILGAFISNTYNNLVEIVLKISSENINSVIQSFRRHEYEIISKHTEDDHANQLKERSDYLNKYLNI